MVKEAETSDERRVRSRKRMWNRETGDDKGNSLTSRLSLGDGGIGIGFAGVLPDAVTALLIAGRLRQVLMLGARTITMIALEAETAGTRARSGRGCRLHDADGGRSVDELRSCLLALRN